MPILTVVRTVTGATPASLAAVTASDTVLAVSGYEIAGATGGLIAGFGGLVGTWIALRSNARTARRAYQAELQAQFDKGAKETREQMQIQLQAAATRLDDIRGASNDRIEALEAEARYWRDRFTRLVDRPPP